MVVATTAVYWLIQRWVQGLKIKDSVYLAMQIWLAVISKPLPFFLRSDEIFSLRPWLLRPFPVTNLPDYKKIYNYRYSKAQKTIENTFVILAA